RTWGGVIGVWPRHRLADGTLTTQPEYSFAFDDVAWPGGQHRSRPRVHGGILPPALRPGHAPRHGAGRWVLPPRPVRRPPPPPRPKPSERPRLAAPPLPPRLTGAPVPTG